MRYRTSLRKVARDLLVVYATATQQDGEQIKKEIRAIGSIARTPRHKFHIPVADLRARLSAVIDEVSDQRGAAIITRRGTPVAAIVPYDDYLIFSQGLTSDERLNLTDLLRSVVQTVARSDLPSSQQEVIVDEACGLKISSSEQDLEIVSTRHARDTFTHLIARVRQGKSITITSLGDPVAQLVPYNQPHR